MNAITASAIVSVAGMALFAVLVAFALYIKGRVRASGRIGTTSFDIEATEKQAQMRPRSVEPDARGPRPTAVVGPTQPLGHRRVQRGELGAAPPHVPLG